MKKAIFVAVLSLGSLTTFAHETHVSPAETFKIVKAQDEYTEIETSALPEAVTKAVAKNYPTATINKAYINKEEHYKLEVSLEDGTTGTLYADKDGNWLDQ
ncbi:hypothetical protein [Spongiimicrobium salis]|uniref:hypothetical protein n=1 Tax=Spongiimicrobium salis TaxID=1667022 RepID=UPI00374DBE41